MCDQVDEDALSVQLESSLTLEDGDDLLNTSSNRDSPCRSNERKTSLDSMFSPFKTDKDLRKEVLIRNLRTTPNKGEGDATESTSSHDKDHIHPDKGQEDLQAEQIVSDTDVNTDLNVILEPEDGSKAFQLQTEKCIVLDEIHSPNSSVVEILEIPLLPAKLEKEEKPAKKPSGLDVDYVSKDPLENADNNNPDWQLLQKLETDEERYKAVRERWRNLIVPEPNKDLTCFAWCRRRYLDPKNVMETPKKPALKSAPEDDSFRGRKRTFSACALDSPLRRGREVRNTEKRVRTVSCTRIYDDKIATLRRHVSEECLKIDRERMYAMEDLQKQYLSEKRSLSNWSLNTGYSISKELYKLDRSHYQKRKTLSVSYEDLSSKVWQKKASELTTLEAAAAEVLAFHKFYQGLDAKAPESMVLTEEQIKEVEEINSMYDAFYKFYEE